MQKEYKKPLRIFFISSFFLFLVSCGGGSSSSSESSGSSFQSYTWETAEPEAVGLTSDNINSALNYALGAADANFRFSQSAIIAKDGLIVGEGYKGISTAEKNSILAASNTITDAELEAGWGTRTAESLVHSWSMGKSFTSILIGIAQDQGILSINDAASTYINEWNNAGDQRQNITIKNLLDMSSGLHQGCYNAEEADYVGNCADSPGYPQNASSGGDFAKANDQLTGCINQTYNDAKHGAHDVTTPFAEYFVYSNCDTMILGEILYRASGQNIYRFGQENLFNKLGITAYWWRDNATYGQDNGNYVSYAGLDMTARDFLKVGQLLLNDGMWEGERVLSSAYVQQIINATRLNHYGLKFWKYPTNPNFSPPTTHLAGMVGFDGQYVVMDFDNNILIARNSLYVPRLELNSERKMIVSTVEGAAVNFPLTVPTILTTTAENTLATTFQMFQMISCLYVAEGC